MRPQKWRGGVYLSVKKIIKLLCQWSEPCYSTSTIKRTLFAMRVDFQAPIEYSTKHRGYYYTISSYRLPFVFLPEDEYEILCFALQGLKTLPLEKSKITSIQDLLSPLANPLSSPTKQPTANDTKGTKHAQKIIFLQNEYSALNQDNSLLKTNFLTLLKAQKEQKQVTFEYKKLGSKEYEKRCGWPYQLLFDTYNKNGWTLWAFDIDRQETRLFLLSRMQNVQMNKIRFELPSDFEFNKNGAAFFGAFSSLYEWNFSIVFYGEAKRKIEGKTWGKNQTLTKTKDGGVRLKFCGSEYSEVLHWTLSFGKDVKIEKPKSLLKDYNKTVKAMYFASINKASIGKTSIAGDGTLGKTSIDKNSTRQDLYR